MQCPFYTTEVQQSSSLNPLLIQQYLAAREDVQTRESHYFEGRFENIYMDRQQVPALKIVLDQAAVEVQNILRSDRLPRVGFWFNEMMPGHRTLPHTHDDDDERMSGVYYIQVAEFSGDLLLGKPPSQQRITPKAGRLIFFSPDLVHEVEANQSGQMRLSLGMNFGFVAP